MDAQGWMGGCLAAILALVVVAAIIHAIGLWFGWW